MRICATILATDIIDEIIKVSSADAIQTAKELSAREGVICGISAGANAYAARELTKRYGADKKRIVTILCDTGERYLSTLLYYHE